MFDDLGILIYLDEILVKSISAVQGSGYIDIRATRKIWDFSISERSHLQQSESNFLEDRDIKDKREGFKGYNKVDAITNTCGTITDNTKENRGLIRCEEEVKKIYTSYVYHKEFFTGLMTNGRIKEVKYGKDCKEGDYVYFKGTLLENSILSYVEGILLIINAFGDSLDNFIRKDSMLKTSQMKVFLTQIKEKLECKNIFDLMVNLNGNIHILQVSGESFINCNCCKNSNIGCNLNIIGKVMRNTGNGNCVNLLRRLDQFEFYHSILIEIDNIFSKINLGFSIPRLQKCYLYDCLQIIPISIYV